MKFDKLYKILIEQTRRTHLTRTEIEKVFVELAQSVGIGPYIVRDSDKEKKYNKFGINALSDQTKYEALKNEVKRIFTDVKGVNKDYKNSLKKDGFEVLVKMLDELDLWRDYPAAS